MDKDIGKIFRTIVYILLTLSTIACYVIYTINVFRSFFADVQPQEPISNMCRNLTKYYLLGHITSSSKFRKFLDHSIEIQFKELIPHDKEKVISAFEDGDCINLYKCALNNLDSDPNYDFKEKTINLTADYVAFNATGRVTVNIVDPFVAYIIYVILSMPMNIFYIVIVCKSDIWSDKLYNKFNNYTNVNNYLWITFAYVTISTIANNIFLLLVSATSLVNQSMPVVICARISLVCHLTYILLSICSVFFPKYTILPSYKYDKWRRRIAYALVIIFTLIMIASMSIYIMLYLKFKDKFKIYIPYNYDKNPIGISANILEMYGPFIRNLIYTILSFFYQMYIIYL